MGNNCREMTVNKAKRIVFVIILCIIATCFVYPFLENEFGPVAYALPIVVCVVGLVLVLNLRRKLGPF